MRFKGRMELEHGLKPIDIAPLIDVIFLLLVFFMLTSSFIMQPGIKVRLPRAVTAEAVAAKQVEILITSDNNIYLNARIVAMDELKNYFKQAGQRNSSVLIKSDKRAALGRVVEIWDLAREAGISQVNIATNQEPFVP